MIEDADLAAGGVRFDVTLAGAAAEDGLVGVLHARLAEEVVQLVAAG